jgi:hypothetical protein
MPGHRISLTLWQARTLADFAVGHHGTVELEERGSGYLLVRLLDFRAQVTAERLLPPVDPG